MLLTLVRHTTPDIPEGTCYGSLDLPVADTFEAESDAVVAQLIGAEVLISSPLRRCRFLANKIAKAFDLVVVIDERLREMDFGSWEGTLWNEIPRDEIDVWREDFYHGRPHGGESVAMLVDRVKAATTDYRSTNKTHIVVCHSGVIKAATSNGTDQSEFETNLPFGGVLQI